MDKNDQSVGAALQNVVCVPLMKRRKSNVLLCRRRIDRNRPVYLTGAILDHGGQLSVVRTTATDGLASMILLLTRILGSRVRIQNRLNLGQIFAAQMPICRLDVAFDMGKLGGAGDDGADLRLRHEPGLG